jgi:ubiquinone/menaquinone biosynthesis C-methylase UbiE
MMKFIRRFKDLGISGHSAQWYDKNSRNHRIEEMKGYADEVIKHVKNGASILDAAPGPGYLAIELAKLGHYKITGLDISNDFVNIARANAKAAGVDVEFKQGNISDMPFADNIFDFITCTAAFKNFKEPIKALNEMFRVLKPGAAALIVDMDRDVTGKQLDNYANNIGVKGIEALFMRLIFKYFLIKGAYNKDEFINLISRTSFKVSDIKKNGIALYVYLKKT